MTEVMNSCEPTMEDFGTAPSGEQAFQIFPDTHDRYPKLSKRLPSIVVEPTECGEVESGELRWPPDDLSCADSMAETPPSCCEPSLPTAGQELEVQSDNMGGATGGDSN